MIKGATVIIFGNGKERTLWSDIPTRPTFGVDASGERGIEKSSQLRWRGIEGDASAHRENATNSRAVLPDDGTGGRQSPTFGPHALGDEVLSRLLPESSQSVVGNLGVEVVKGVVVVAPNQPP